MLYKHLRRINLRFPKIFTILGILLFGSLLLLTFSRIIQNLRSGDLPDGDPAKGMIYKGLGPRQKTGTCKDIFAINVDGRLICTHGPDPAPAGLDVRKRQEPGFVSKQQSAVRNTSKVAGITCTADGKSGKRVQVLFVRSSDVEDRFGAFLPDFKATLSDLNQQVIDSAAKTGGNRYIRFVHDGNCEPIIEHVVLSPTGDDTIENTVKELDAKGYNKNNRIYFIWRDSNQLCGIANVWNDESPGLDNLSNILKGNALVDNGCWGKDTQLHELGHSLGAVQKSAPVHDGSHPFHAKDKQDILYYIDEIPRICLWDCNNDDYFSTNPAPGSYLATHWNIANNEFLGGDEDKRPKFAPGPAGAVYAVNREGGSGKTELHALSAASNFSSFNVQSATKLDKTPGSQWAYAIGNFYDDDYLVDLYGINMRGGSGKTEVHILSGKSNYTEFALQTAIPLDPTDDGNWVFDIGDGPDEDFYADIFAINKKGASGKTEAHIIQGGPGNDYQKFSNQIATGLGPSTKNWDFVVGSYSDEYSYGSDIYAINRKGSSGKTEIHILSAKSGYQDFILQTATPIGPTDSSQWSFSTGYFDNDLKADLYAINRKGASGKTEVHILSAESNFQEFITQAASTLGPTNSTQWSFAPSQEYNSNGELKPQDPVKPNPQDPVKKDPVDPKDPVKPNPQDPVKKDPEKPIDPIKPLDPMPFVCGGSPNSICTSPTISINPDAPDNNECLDPRGTTEKINDWINGYIRKVTNYLNAIIGNPQQPLPPRPVPCVKQ